MQKNLIITLLFSIVIALFAILNAAAIPVNLIFVTVDVSAALVILIAASLGAILVYSLDIGLKIKLKKSLKVAEKNMNQSNERIVTMERELNDKIVAIERASNEEIKDLKNEIAILETQLDEKPEAPKAEKETK